MFNPLKMNPIEKRMLLGGLVGSVTYYTNLYAMTYPNYPAQLKDRVEPHMPRNGELIGSVAPPAVLFVTKKIVKNTATKEKVGDMTLGATLFSVPNLTRDIVSQTAYQVGVDSKPPAARLPISQAMSKYAASRQTPARVTAPTGISKYAITA